MEETQSCFETKKVGSNINIDHRVYNLIYLVELFFEFYPEELRIDSVKIRRIVVYTKKELLTFVLWGKNNNKNSGRELSEWCDNNDETCQLVLNCKKPSKSTINRFINENADLIDKFDQFLVDLGMKLGLIDGEILYADGTILKAWCNTFNKMYPYEINYLKKFLKSNHKNEELWNKLKKYYLDENQDEKLKEELQDLLNEFDYNLNSSGIHLLKLSLISSKNFQKVLERIKHMEKNISGENSISIVDPESRHMVDKKGKMGLNYNYQTVTDSKYGFRVAHYLTNNTNDQKEIKRLTDTTAKRIHTDHFIICVDNGYWNTDLLKEIYKTNTRVIIPDDTDASRKKKKIQDKKESGKRQEIKNKNKKNKKDNKNSPKRIKKYEFKYHGDIDAFECPKTNQLLKVEKIVKIQGIQKKKYTCDYCNNCEYKSECTSQHKRTFYELYDKDIEEIRKFYYSKEGQEIYSKRGHFAETSFAILIESRNFRGIKRRGIQKANNELTLLEVHHNIKKFEIHTTNKFLKLITNKAKKHRKETGKLDFIFIEKFKEKLIIKKDVIVGIRDD